MRLETVLSYPAGPREVAALLADPARMQEVASSGDGAAHRAQVSVDGAAEGAFTLTVERWLPTADMPDVAKRFVGEHLHLTQVERWDAPAPDGSRTGVLEVAVVGAPVRARATASLRASAAGCEERIDGDLTASVPLIGSRVEKAAAGPLMDALHEQERALSARLSGA